MSPPPKWTYYWESEQENLSQKIWYRMGFFGRLIPMVTYVKVSTLYRNPWCPPQPGSPPHEPEFVRTLTIRRHVRLTWSILQELEGIK